MDSLVQEMEAAPTVFHITHWKAGSQWLRKILSDVAEGRIVQPEIDEKQFLERDLIQGGVYPAVYVTREQFYSVKLPKNHRRFVVIRDLRDTLVSGYFSIRYSHALNDDRLILWRKYLESTSLDSGLLMLMDEWLPASAKIQSSWVCSGEKVIRYDDLLSNDLGLLEKIFLEDCQLQVSSEELAKIIEKNRFENLTKGRARGDEDILSHERKGISGDWRNHFSDVVCEKFNRNFGSVLRLCGCQV